MKSVYYSVGSELYEVVNKMRPWTTLYGKNYFLTSGPGIMAERKKEAILSVQRAKEEITKLAEEVGYSVEFTKIYPDKIVFRRTYNFVKKEGFPDYFRIDSFNGNIID